MTSLWTDLSFSAQFMEMLSSPLMQRALLAAVLVGISAPVVGTYLVQRRLTLLGDGIGHVALAGVAIGWLTGNILQLETSDMLAVPAAIVVSVLGAIVVEIVRWSGKTSGDVALALMFYGGMASGVIIITFAGGTTVNLNSYLFGSIATVSVTDVYLIGALSVLILAVGLGLRPVLFAISQDENFARSRGLPTRFLNLLVAVVAALTVAVAMRVVGVLLVSAIMVIPVASAQLIARSFKSTMHLAMLLGLLCTVGGLIFTYFYAFSPGAMIVCLAIFTYMILGAFTVLKSIFYRTLTVK